MADTPNFLVTDYRLKAVTFKSLPQEPYSVVSSQRGVLIFQEPPNFLVTDFRIKAVTFVQRPVEMYSVVMGVRGAVIIQEPPNFFATDFRVKAVTWQMPPMDLNSVVVGMRTAVLFQAPISAVMSQRTVVILEQTPFGPPATAHEVFEMVMQDNPVPTPGEIFSTERAIQNWQMVMQGNPVPPPLNVWSMTRAAETIETVLLARPVSVQSFEYLPSTVELILQDRFVYTPQSRTSTLAVAELALQSLSEQYVAVSMDYAKSSAELVLIDKPMSGMPTSPAVTFSLAEKVLRARPTVFPRSTTSGNQVAQLVLRANDLPLARGPEHVAEVVQMFLLGTDMGDDYHRPVNVVESVELVLTDTVMQEFVGMEHSAQVVEMLLQDAPPDRSIVGRELAVQQIETVLMALPVPPPDKMSGAMYAEVGEMLLIDKPMVPPAEITSPAIVPQAGLLWLVDSPYLKPEDMIPPTRSIQAPEIAHTTLLARQSQMPWSFTRVAEIVNLTVMDTHYDTPAEMLRNGAFMTLVGQQVMLTADYPATTVPQSQAVVDLASQQALFTANDYPDKGYSISDAIVSLVAAQALQTDSDFPDKDQVQSEFVTDVVAEVAAVTDESFPDKDLVQSQVITDIVAEMAAVVVSDYPDKDMVQSSLDASFIAEIAAITAAYPDKDAPQGALEVSMVATQVLSRDATMYTLPSYPGRNKPMVFTTIVY